MLDLRVDSCNDLKVIKHPVLNCLQVPVALVWL